MVKRYIESLHVTLLSTFEFHDNRWNDKYAFLKGFKAKLTVFLHFF